MVLAGPSGSGKSRLASRLSERHRWPVLRLDDFYRPHDHPDLPRSEALGGLVDWDDPRSWDQQGALEALARLVHEGRTETPVYDLSSSSVIGERAITASPTSLVIAEGIFAAEIIPQLRDRHLLHSAWCVRHPRVITFVLRLARDLSERRKPWPTLLRRGLVLLREEPGIVAGHVALGARPARPRTVELRLGSGRRRAR